MDLFLPMSNSSVTNTCSTVQYVQKVQQEKIRIINQSINTDGVSDADLEAKRWKVRSNCDRCSLKSSYTYRIIGDERDAIIIRWANQSFNLIYASTGFLQV